VRHLFGIEDGPWRNARQVVPSVLDTSELINGHMLLAGMSGTGKSYQLLRYIDSAQRNGIEVDVFDVHEELDQIPGCVARKFSEATMLGFNPLVPSLDPHSGGIRRQIEAVVDLINRTSRKLGPRQESALRHLLSEVYGLRGMYADNPASWDRRIITEAEFDDLVQRRDYQELRRCQPLLRDVLSYAERKLKAITLGADSRSISALERVEKTTAKLHTLRTKRGKAVTDEEVARIEQQWSDEKANAIEAYSEYINGMETGREYADLARYSNVETLKSLMERLQDLQDSGIFRSNPPDWEGATVRVHQLASLRDDERRLLFFMRCEAILRRAMDAGRTDRLRHVIVADEGHLYYDQDPDNYIARISKEGRKFGLGLVIGSQSPTHFADDFLTNCAAVVLCGLHSSFWDGATRKLRCEREVLASTRAREVVAIKYQRLGETEPGFVNVIVNQDVVAQAVSALRTGVVAAAPGQVAHGAGDAPGPAPRALPSGARRGAAAAPSPFAEMTR
jgi:hypothetical protein